MLKKEYLGEVGLPLDDWFRGEGALGFDDPHNQVRHLVWGVNIILFMQFPIHSRSRPIWYPHAHRHTQRGRYKSSSAS
jgi:hypothetical protein